jgi:hypothetical protein
MRILISLGLVIASTSLLCCGGDNEAFPDLLKPAQSPDECVSPKTLPLMVEYRDPQDGCASEGAVFMGCVVYTPKPWEAEGAEGGHAAELLYSARCTTRADGAVFCVNPRTGSNELGDEAHDRQLAATIWMINRVMRDGAEHELWGSVTEDGLTCFPEIVP